jgi:hypothetical protein
MYNNAPDADRFSNAADPETGVWVDETPAKVKMITS